MYYRYFFFISIFDIFSISQQPITKCLSYPYAYLKTEDASIDPVTVMSSQSKTRPSSDENKLPVPSNATTSRSSGD